MGVLDFIFGVLILLTIIFIVAGVTGMIWDTKDLKQENDELKDQMKKLSKNGGKTNEQKTKE